MAARRAAAPTQPTAAVEGDAVEGASAEGEGFGSVESAARELVRPRGQKAAKQDLVEVGRRDSILKSQARATEQMAAANMRKAEAMQDHSAMALFKMNLDELDQGAREYFELRRSEEIERIRRRIDAEKRVAERERAEHDRLMQEREADGLRGKRPRTAPTNAAPVQTAPSPRIPAPVPASTAPSPRIPSPPPAAPPSLPGKDFCQGFNCENCTCRAGDQQNSFLLVWFFFFLEF